MLAFVCVCVCVCVHACTPSCVCVSLLDGFSSSCEHARACVCSCVCACVCVRVHIVRNIQLLLNGELLEHTFDNYEEKQHNKKEIFLFFKTIETRDPNLYRSTRYAHTQRFTRLARHTYTHTHTHTHAKQDLCYA